MIEKMSLFLWSSVRSGNWTCPVCGKANKDILPEGKLGLCHASFQFHMCWETCVFCLHSVLVYESESVLIFVLNMQQLRVIQSSCHH